MDMRVFNAAGVGEPPADTVYVNDLNQSPVLTSLPADGFLLMPILAADGINLRVAKIPVATLLAAATRNLFTATLPRTVSSAGTKTSAVPTVGVGSMTIPANFMKPGRVLKLVMRGSYFTPMLATNVSYCEVGTEFGGTVMSLTRADANLLAANSATRELYCENLITCVTDGVNGTAYSSGFMTFGVGVASTITLPFSTASMLGDRTGTIPINTTVPNLIDVTEKWGNTRSDQGTTITQTTLEVLN